MADIQRTGREETETRQSDIGQPGIVCTVNCLDGSVFMTPTGLEWKIT
jgi:hypothetical protein